MAIDPGQLETLQRMLRICGDVSAVKNRAKFVCQLEPGHGGFHSKGGLSWTHGDGTNALSELARKMLPELLSDVQRLQRVAVAAGEFLAVFNARAGSTGDRTGADLRAWGVSVEQAADELFRSLEATSETRREPAGSAATG